MNERAEKYEAFLDDLAAVVDGEEGALERHGDFLADDDEARDLRHEAAETAELMADAGADFAMPADFEASVLRLVDGGGGDEKPGRTTSPGFAAVGAAEKIADDDSAVGAEPESNDDPAEADVNDASLGIAPTLESPVISLPSSSSDVSDDEAVKSAPTEKKKPIEKKKLGKLLLFPLIAGLGLAAAAALALVFLGGDATTDPSGPDAVAAGGITGTLEHIARAGDDGRSGVEIRRPRAEEFVALSAGANVEAGSVLRTDERTRARLRLADGSQLVLDHATELALVGGTPRSFRLTDGALVADIAHLEDGPNASFQTATGRVEVLGTKFQLSATQDVTSVRVSRGMVSVSGNDGTASEVRAGEEGLVRAGNAPSVAPVTGLANELAWAEFGGEAAADDQDSVAGIGSLRARRPGEREDRERPLELARHSVRVRIVGNVARTEIEEVFRNDSDHTLEGVYRFPLPADAQIARLALDVEGRMEEGSFVERDRAAAIWRGVIRNATPVRQRRNDEEFIWVPGPWTDPAILEWQRGGQFELRIFPIPAHGERRVVLGYTQNVQPQGTQRRYVYPLAHSADDSTRVGHFDVDVRVAGAERVEASGYRVTSAAESDATRLRLSEDGFTPKGDLTIDYALPGGEREIRWWTYRGEAAAPPPADSRERDREVADIQRRLAEDTRPYVTFALRPELPRAGARRQRDYVLVVDASQSMYGERYDRARRLTTGVVRQMDRRDRFTVLACDYQCQTMPGGMLPPSAQTAAGAEEWLEGIEAAGASDLSAILREAVATVSSDRRDDRELHVLYVGDGTSTAGYRRAAALATETRTLVEGEHVAISTVGVGGDADTMALRAIARSAGGHYVPYVPGQRISVAAMAVLETTYGASLENPRVELPDGLSEIAPTALPTIRTGQEVLVVGRMDRERVEGNVVLRGTVAGRPFERSYEVELVPTDAAGNRFVPRLWAAGRIEELQLSGRGEDRGRIIATSKAFGVLSRHTSLLVLESEAMFRAFRVDRNRSTVAQWTGEEDVVAGGEAGEVVDGVLGGALDTVATRGRAGRRARRRRGGARAGGGGAGGTAGGMGRGMMGPMPSGRTAAQSAPRMAFDEAEPAEAAAEAAPPPPPARDADREDEGDRRRNEVTATETQRRQIARPRPRPRRPGSWMRRVRVRVGEIQRRRDVTAGERRAADDADSRLRANPDSRDRHRDAVRRLARAGRLERALEVADAWIARDREDPEALTAKADLLGRMGDRDAALRLLTGTVDLAPNSESLHRRLAGAFERAGRLERACAHRIALAEIDENDVNAVAAAMRCERSLGREEAAQRILMSVRDARVRTRAERAAGQEDGGDSRTGRRAPTGRSRSRSRVRRFGGDFTIDAEWSGGQDLDVSILTRQGTRLSWMGGRTTVVGDQTTEGGRERLGLRWTGPGTYIIEVGRTDPQDRSEIRGRVRVRILGQRRTIPFVLTSERVTVARVRVTRESRLEAVTGTVR